MPRPKYPLLVGTLVALILLSAGLARAQESSRRVTAPTRPLPRGTVLTPEDIVYRDSTIRGPIETNGVAVGWIMRRLIGAGEVLRAPAVERPAIVSANTPGERECADRNITLTLNCMAP
jgi:flagella basal body P-ring formation protein FlgA